LYKTNCKENQFDDFELNKRQILSLIELSKFKKSDIFYDLGSATGKIVREVIKNTNVKKAIGIESNFNYYNIAWNCAINELKKQDLYRIDFWLSSLDNQDIIDDNKVIDFSNATIVYYSLDEVEGDKTNFKDWKIWNKVRLLKKDIPLIGYASKPNRSNDDCWLFLSKPPYKKLNKIDWIKSIHPDFNTFNDVYNYYYTQIEKRMRENPKKSEKKSKKEARNSLFNLKLVINERF